MRVSDLMTADVVSISSDATITDAIARLADEHVSALVVVSRANRLLGVISTADILQAEAATDSSDAREILFERTSVADLMTQHSVTIPPDADVREAARNMLYAGVHRLIVEVDGEPVGVISQSDVVRGFVLGRV